MKTSHFTLPVVLFVGSLLLLNCSGSKVQATHDATDTTSADTSAVKGRYKFKGKSYYDMKDIEMSSKSYRLNMLKNLYDGEALTEQEYQKEKAKVLDGTN